MVHGENRIPYWIDRRLTGLAGPDFDATISGLPFEPEDSQYGKCPDESFSFDLTFNLLAAFPMEGAPEGAGEGILIPKVEA